MWLAKTAIAIATTLGVLQGIPVGEEQTAVPPDANLLMTNAKHDLRELAREVLKSQPGDGPVIAPAVRNAMIAALEKEGIAIGAESTAEQYGNVSSIDVVAPQGHSDLLAVVVALSIPCGSDSALFLFRHDSAWRLIYERQEDDYELISGALGSFAWKVSPPDAEGRFLVVTSSISPWCSSAWQRLRYQVDRIERGREEAILVDSGDFTSYEWDVELDATADSYSIHFNGSSLDSGITVRSYRLHYVLDGDQPVRVDPIADSPRDFVEEWLSMSGETAARWGAVDPETLAERHGAFIEFGPTGRCSENVWQVRLDHFDEGDSEEVASTYFIVTESNGAYRMREIAYEPRDDCPASDTIAGSE
jgi:hypothetical protein